MIFLSSFLFLMWSLRDLRSNLILPFPSSLVTKKVFRSFLSFRGFLCQMEIIADISFFAGEGFSFTFSSIWFWKTQDLENTKYTRDYKPPRSSHLSCPQISSNYYLFTHLKDSSINIIYWRCAVCFPWIISLKSSQPPVGRLRLRDQSLTRLVSSRSETTCPFMKCFLCALGLSQSWDIQHILSATLGHWAGG